MSFRLLLLCSALISAAPTVVQAQQASTTAPGATRRELAAERREATRLRREARMAVTPEQRAAARARREARFSAMPADQQAYLRSLRTYQQGLKLQARELRAQVRAGTLTQDAMAQQLKAYRDANRPARPAGMPERRRPDGGA
jgi:hypothetical protein